MWCELIKSFPVSDESYQGRFQEPASESEIEILEHELRVTVPMELKELLSETNGVSSIARGRFIWSAKEIQARNKEYRTSLAFREMYMPFDSMLFFGDNGGGDHYFYRILSGSIREKDIYEWNHETDDRMWRASDLKRFLQQMLSAN